MIDKCAVSHLTSVHNRLDTRIFLKECRSLAAYGCSVSLVVADGKGDESRDGVAIFDVGAPSGRLRRMLETTRRVFEKAKLLNADVYHIHDPELIPTGLKLKQMGKAVIFDAHEDVPKQILSKPYLSKPAKVVLSATMGGYEKWACKKMNAVVAATPFIRDKFLSMNINSVDVNNYPLLGELSSEEVDWSQKRSQVCYIGGIAAVRGIHEIVAAMQHVKTDVRLQLGGSFSEKSVENTVRNCFGWSRVDELGWLSRAGVSAVLKYSVAGLVTLHPTINYMDALPVKMFEYMSAGIPVIASNFPLWREIIEGNDCGLCVDPLDPRAIAEAIDFLINNPDRAEQMGRNGQCAVNERYNWNVEERKLLELYSSLI
jgi:glycosyltransferase involved in cell wall biosynthesis